MKNLIELNIQYFSGFKFFTFSALSRLINLSKNVSFYDSYENKIVTKVETQTNNISQWNERKRKKKEWKNIESPATISAYSIAIANLVQNLRLTKVQFNRLKPQIKKPPHFDGYSWDKETYTDFLVNVFPKPCKSFHFRKKV